MMIGGILVHLKGIPFMKASSLVLRNRSINVQNVMVAGTADHLGFKSQRLHAPRDSSVMR